MAAGWRYDAVVTMWDRINETGQTELPIDINRSYEQPEGQPAPRRASLRSAA